MNDQSSILSILRSVNCAEEDDVAFISAATINLFLESIRRISGRALLNGSDAKALFSVLEIILTERHPLPARNLRPAKLSEEESESLLKAVEEGMRVP